MNDFSTLKNILFDLGGVILDLDVNATLEGFLNLGFPKEMLNYPENLYTDVFYNYETGRSTTEQFREEIRKNTGVDFIDKDFDAAWIAMLYKVPYNRTVLLRRLAEKYNLYLLSNTSPLHIEAYDKMFFETAGYEMKEVFQKLYYSYVIGEHKPDEAAFQYVLNDSGIKAGETLFLDDNIHNIKAAKELGFNVIHISKQLPMEKVGFDR